MITENMECHNSSLTHHCLGTFTINNLQFWKKKTQIWSDNKLVMSTMKVSC